MSIKKNLAYNILLSVSNIIFPIITFPYVSRVLGPEGTGLTNFVLSFCQYFILLSALGISIYGVREIAKTKDNIEGRSKVFIELFLIRLLTTIIVLVPYFITILYFDKFSSHNALYLWGGLYIFFNLFSIEWFFTGMENFKYITSRSIIIKFISIGALFLFVKEKSDVLPYFLITVFGLIFNSFVNIRYSLKYLKLNISYKELYYKPHVRPMLVIFGSTVAISVYVLMDTILLGLLADEKAVGYYSAALKLNKLSLTIITSLGAVLVPRLSNAVAKNDQAEIKRLIGQSFNFVYTLGIPIMVGIFALAPELTLVFSGKEFLPSVLAMRILCPITLIIGLSNIFGIQILTPLSKDRQLLFSVLSGTIISLLLNFILIPLFHENGAAITNLIAETVVTVLTFYFARKYLTFELNLKAFTQNVLSALPIFLLAEAAKLIFSQPFYVLVATLIGSMVLFGATQLYIIKNQIAIDFFLTLKSKLNYA
ncbi:flippase [Solitalea lacus]|uniref:flippase n=1 Tax=Solitalea lacus TaxID=2911172 RepID=UPI001EDC55C4|nr:flippase [Solitalea lacus]UKJ07077.1 flippase [Solitalea lacus]